jgi:diaminopimelate decarboxylase
MFYDAYHHIENISNPSGAEKIFSSRKYLRNRHFRMGPMLHEVREGDHLVFHNAGAYGFEMSSILTPVLKPQRYW